MLKNTEGAIKNGQSRETGNIVYTRQRKTKQKQHIMWLTSTLLDVLFTLFVFVCVHWFPTHNVLFLFCFSLSCVHYVTSFSGLSIFDTLKQLIVIDLQPVLNGY
jgi:uncharacterized membrane protein